MGMYTEINVCFDLLKDTPKDIVDILHCLVEGTDTPSILPEHKFFKCDRWDMVACCDSYYFDGSTNSKMVFDDISKTWKINIRANLKNYDSEIEEFLDWLEPYIETDGFIGYMRYEEWEDPTLIYNDFDNNKIIFKGIETIRRDYNELIAKCESAKFADDDETVLSDIHQGVNSGLSMAIHFAKELRGE